ncbi:sugar transferase [Candidatus Marinimicrobia bacterium]|nr:sugar transferase [Candidatus Neomarinimicrobiota bacterium]
MIQKIITIFLLILLAPIFLLVSIVIWLDDGFPLLYIQKNYGKNHTVFSLYKFRTMKKNTPSIPTEEMTHPKKYLLRSGSIIRKFSLDELPQFFNVLNGTMNVIGPRPCMLNNENIIKNLRENYGIDKIKPGITGLAQVNGRDANNYATKVDWDKKYMENQSLLLDLKIILKTFYVILIPKNIKH